MKQIALMCFLVFNLSCSKEIIMNCSSTSYYSSDYHRQDTGFSRTQRNLSSRFSEKEMAKIYGETGLSCKKVLSRYFYCNICFNQKSNFLIAYNGKRYDIEESNTAIEYTQEVIGLLSEMQMGGEEYHIFLNDN
jgi:hypothetical protein